MNEDDLVVNKDLHKKLFDFRDLEGQAKFENIENVRLLNEISSENPSIIAIVPYGSTVGGYSNEDSDFDLRVLYDSSLKSDSDDHGLENLKEVHRTVKHAIAEVPGLTGKKVTHIEHDLNPKYVRESLISLDPNKMTWSTHGALAQVCRLVPGDKIREYREIYSKEIGELSKEFQELAVSQIADYFTGEDLMRSYKIRKRTGMSEIEAAELVNKRRDMWKSRARKILLKKD